MLGRGREREAVDALLNDAGGEGRRGLLFVGDPGIGKTTLLAHAGRTARERGWLVLSARGDAVAAEHPYDALSSLLRPLEVDIEALPERLATALQVALGLASGTTESHTVSSAALRIIATRAETQPVLLALDDVQWFDRSSTAVIAFVHRHLDRDHVATVATAAAGHPEGAPEWGRALAVQPLAGLDDHELTPLVGEVSLAPAVVRRCRDLTLGNPLGFVELVHRLQPGQRAGLEPLPALSDPGPLVTQAFARRLAGLPARVRRALTVAAADETGRLPVVRAALAVLGAPADLAPAEAAGIVAIAGDELAFTHPLLRVAAYHTVAAPSRRKAHQALAAVLDEPRNAEHRAWQMAAAADGPDEPAAAGLVLVAERARARGAPASAAQVLEQAASLAVDAGLAADRLALAGELWLGAGQLDRASSALARARMVAPPAATPLSAHLWGAVADRWAAGPAQAAARLRVVLADAADPTAVETLTAAIADEDHLAGGDEAAAVSGAASGDGPTAVRDRALLRTAAARLDGEAGAVASVPALLGPLACGSPLALDAAALTARALILGGELLAAYRLLTTALAAGASTIPAGRALADLELARVDALLGRTADAEARLDDVRAIGRSLGIASLDNLERRVRALISLGAGRFADAVAALAPLERPGAADGAALAADHAEAVIGAGRAVDAAVWRRRLDPIDAADGTVAAGLARRAGGLAAGDRAEIEDAARVLEPFLFEHARTLLVLCERERAPSAEAAVAAAIFERVGAAPWAARARAVAEPAATAPAPVPNPAATALAALSAAELRVAVAVGAGRSNREAAEELFLSIKTIDHHLQHIYRKLALRGRAELAILVTKGSA